MDDDPIKAMTSAAIDATLGPMMLTQESQAWDSWVAASIRAGSELGDAVRRADFLLDERRKRFDLEKTKARLLEMAPSKTELRSIR